MIPILHKIKMRIEPVYADKKYDTYFWLLSTLSVKKLEFPSWLTSTSTDINDHKDYRNQEQLYQSHNEEIEAQPYYTWFLNDKFNLSMGIQYHIKSHTKLVSTPYQVSVYILPS